MSKSTHHQQAGFTLVEMIMVIVITGIIGGMVAVFLKAPIQQYMDVARRAELTDIADTAMRRMVRDVRIAVPNSVRPVDVVSTYIEFLPSKDGGRYRLGLPGNLMTFGTGVVSTTFDIVGSGVNATNADFIVAGSLNSSGMPPYDQTATGVLRGPISYTHPAITFPSPQLGDNANTGTQRFAVVDGAQRAVTYVCEGTQGGVLDANQNGRGKLMRYSNYGFNSVQVLPTTGGAILADKVRACEFLFGVPPGINGVPPRFGMLAVRLTLTSGGESVSLYNEIHVNNAP